MYHPSIEEEPIKKIERKKIEFYEANHGWNGGENHLVAFG